MNKALNEIPSGAQLESLEKAIKNTRHVERMIRSEISRGTRFGTTKLATRWMQRLPYAVFRPLYRDPFHVVNRDYGSFCADSRGDGSRIHADYCGGGFEHQIKPRVGVFEDFSGIWLYGEGTDPWSSPEYALAYLDRWLKVKEALTARLAQLHRQVKGEPRKRPTPGRQTTPNMTRVQVLEVVPSGTRPA